MLFVTNPKVLSNYMTSTTFHSLKEVKVGLLGKMAE